MSRIREQLKEVFGSKLAPSALDGLERSARLAHLPEGGRLFASGDAAEHFVIVVSGQAKVHLSSRSGRDTTLFRLGPGQCCTLTTSCLLSNTPYYAEGIAESDLEFVLVGSAAFGAVLDSSPELTRTLLVDLAQRIAGLTTLIDRQIGRDLSGELINFLLDRFDADGKLALSHKQIAEELGTAREVVSRKLKALEKAGLVKIERGTVLLANTDSIARMRSRSAGLDANPEGCAWDEDV